MAFWKNCCEVLKRFWTGLSGTNYYGITVPTKFENIQPIPVTIHSQWAADSGDTSPKLYPPFDSNGEPLAPATTDQLGLNQEVMAAIVTEGGDPSTNSYPLKIKSVSGSVAGGAGAIAATTAIAAVTGKKIFVEEIITTLSTNTSAGGVVIDWKDGAGGTTLWQQGLSVNQVFTSYRPLAGGTAATLLEFTGAARDYTALDDNDTCYFLIKYREI